MIRGIVFDCFGVLYGSGAETLRARCPKDALIEFDDLVKQADYGFITGQEYITQLGLLIDMAPDRILELFHQQRVRNTALFEYVRTLRAQYKIGLLSNVSSGTIDTLITPKEQEELFDKVLLSCDIHLVKPDPEIFRLTAERLGLLPEECVMIDDRAENCDGARQAGMQAVWYASNDQAVHELSTLLTRDTQ